MCTAATFETKDFYFGRTLDYDFTYGYKVTITPRNYPFKYRHVEGPKSQYAFIGMATVIDDYPLYYEGVNEKGLGMAGLNFVGNAYYGKVEEGKDNLCNFEFIPWILGQCTSVKEAREALKTINICDTPFSPEMPNGQLHWIIADREEAITVESVKEGLKIYDNPAGVLTNNPPFDLQMFSLNNYMSLSTVQPKNTFSDKLHLDAYSRGMGGLGLPGDLSSQSRFIRVAFTKLNSVCGDSEEESVSQFFHILGSVDQARGLCNLGFDKYEITLYTSCCNADKGIYYYNSYDNRQISAVDMHKEDLDSSKLITFETIQGEQIKWQN